ncbi:MAG: hypothetical protein R2860_15445 [Desulfobacterales bacterium]
MFSSISILVTDKARSDQPELILTGDCCLWLHWKADLAIRKFWKNR